MDLVLLNLTDSLRLEKKLSLPIAKNTIENHMTFLIEGNNMMPSKTYTLDLHDVVMFEVSVTLGNIPGNLLISSEKKGWETTFSPTQLNGETVWLDQDSPPHFGRGNPQIHESAQEAMNEAIDAGITQLTISADSPFLFPVEKADETE